MPNPADAPDPRAVTWNAVEMSREHDSCAGDRDGCGDRRLRACGLSLDGGGRVDSDDAEGAREESDEQAAVGGR